MPKFVKLNACGTEPFWVNLDRVREMFWDKQMNQTVLVYGASTEEIGSPDCFTRRGYTMAPETPEEILALLG